MLIVIERLLHKIKANRRREIVYSDVRAQRVTPQDITIHFVPYFGCKNYDVEGKKNGELYLHFTVQSFTGVHNFFMENISASLGATLFHIFFHRSKVSLEEEKLAEKNNS